MRPLLASELLSIWEQGQGKPSYHKAMLILSAACPEEPSEKLEELSIGNRDSRLLRLREWTFGSEMISHIICPSCGERLEFSLDVEKIRIPSPEPNTKASQLKFDEYLIDFRTLNTSDLLEAGRCPGPEKMQRALIERCVCGATLKGKKIKPEQLPPRVIKALASKMAETEPHAEIQLGLSCPACSHHWHALFDIVSYFWSEIQAWAVRILREVHFLASAYGWREKDILAMSPLRRHYYLGMVGL